MTVAIKNPYFRGAPPTQLDRAHLICFPHAGGTANYFWNWNDELDPSVRLQIVQYPGREARLREPFATSLLDLAREVSEKLESVDDAPLVLYGHSLGAILAFEVARQLEARSRKKPHLLIVSGAGEPNKRDDHSELLAKPSADFKAAIESWGGIPTELSSNSRLWSLIEPRLRADLRLISNYRNPSLTQISCSVVAFAGDDDRLVTQTSIAKWSNWTSAGFESMLLPQHDHFSILQVMPQHLQNVIRLKL